MKSQMEIYEDFIMEIIPIRNVKNYTRIRLQYKNDIIYNKIIQSFSLKDRSFILDIQRDIISYSDENDLELFDILFCFEQNLTYTFNLPPGMKKYIPPGMKKYIQEEFTTETYEVYRVNHDILNDMLSTNLDLSKTSYFFDNNIPYIEHAENLRGSEKGTRIILKSMKYGLIHKINTDNIFISDISVRNGIKSFLREYVLATMDI